jgi:hypothetical protein
MIFPITNLLDDEQSEKWLLEYSHPEGLRCPEKGDPAKRHIFRETRTSRLTVYRCLDCEGIYNLYSGTLFEKKHLGPSQVVLLLRGVVKGESGMRLVEESAQGWESKGADRGEGLRTCVPLPPYSRPISIPSRRRSPSSKRCCSAEGGSAYPGGAHIEAMGKALDAIDR